MIRAPEAAQHARAKFLAGGLADELGERLAAAVAGGHGRRGRRPIGDRAGRKRQQGQRSDRRIAFSSDHWRQGSARRPVRFLNHAVDPAHLELAILGREGEPAFDQVERIAAEFLEPPAAAGY